MRISLIGPFPPYRGGISDFNFALFKELDEAHCVQIVNFSTQYPKSLFPGKTQYKEDLSDVPSSERILSSINPYSWRNTAKEINEFEPDLVIIHFWMPFFALSLQQVSTQLKKNTNTPIVVICHNISPHEKQGFSRILTKTFFTKVDHFVVMSDSVKTDLLKITPNANYVLTPHPIYNIFGEIIDKNDARKKLGVKVKNVILFFGLIREYKGLDILLKCIPLLENELNDFIVIVAGECYENQQKYYDIIKKLEIQGSIDLRLKFIPDDDISKYFSAADVVTLPYKTATQSGITQIAYNFNRPVIVSDVGGLSEIVINNKTGYVVKPNPKEFAKAILNFFNKNKFQAFSNNIHAHKQLFSWSNFVDKIMELTSK